ncbi:MAG TPA: ATP-binding domain-containing protein [Acidimicrobiales bacterium]|nr:ATP-binding domain-containing protein [Acidimicrobiales bacterium]
MSNKHKDLGDEQAHIDHAYRRLDDMRSRAEEMLRSALGSEGGRIPTPAAIEERETAVRTALLRLEQLDIGREPLCFGRIDQVGGDAFHLGRLAVASEEHDPLIVDWRAPVAEPFYRATGRHPLGLRRRRHFLAEGRRLLAIEDEHFGVEGEAPGENIEDGDEAGLGLVGTGVLLAALERSRTGRMRDIVATVQREQDEIIRAPLPGVLVVQGGPGTGKTAVALHRAAYLLYTHRFPLERQGVLVVGPNPLFLTYISHVLPSLGETGVALTTVEGLRPEVRARRTEPVVVARVKGDARMARVISRAVRNRQRALPVEVEVGVEGHTVRLTPDLTRTVVAIAQRRPGTHNSRRRVVETHLWKRLHHQWQAAAERRQRAGLGDSLEMTVEDLRAHLRRRPEVLSALDRMWPVLNPQQLLHDLFGAPALIRLASHGVLTPEEEALLERPRSEAVDEVQWASADIPLLDEAAVLLGPIPDKTKKPDGPADGAPRGYGHIVVDEAQDLSPMALRMLSRRSISGSMTIVGDLGQATGAIAPEQWDDVDSHLPARHRLAMLTVNYRTPSEIMDLAAGVLAVAAPELSAPDSVRSTGEQPVIQEVPGAVLAKEVAAAAAGFGAGDDAGLVGVICPPSLLGSVEEALRAAGVVFGEPDRGGLDETVTLVPVEVCKGLEFDSIVVVEPAAVVEESAQGHRALFVALTRATQNLHVVHSRPLPQGMKGDIAVD